VLVSGGGVLDEPKGKSEDDSGWTGDENTEVSGSGSALAQAGERGPRRVRQRAMLEPVLAGLARAPLVALAVIVSGSLAGSTIRNPANIPLEDLRMPSREIRKLNPAHVGEVANAISTLGFCAPVLVGRDNAVIDGAVRVEAARQLGLGRAPCVRIEHLSETEQRVLRLAVNRLGEKGEWNLDELKFELEELIVADAPIEASGFALDEIDHIILGEVDDVVEEGPLSPEAGAIAVARIGDVFDLGPHRIVCGSATEPETLRRLMEGDAPAQLVLTDEPYNVPIAGHVTGGRHREFAMASGEMTDAEFLAFNEVWMAAVGTYLCDGGVFGTFIDWRGIVTLAKNRPFSADFAPTSRAPSD
jgi:ParB-like nuclease family protein